MACSVILLSLSQVRPAEKEHEKVGVFGGVQLDINLASAARQRECGKNQKSKTQKAKAQKPKIKNAETKNPESEIGAQLMATAFLIIDGLKKPTSSLEGVFWERVETSWLIHSKTKLLGPSDHSS